MTKRDYQNIADCIRVQTFETPGFEAHVQTARCIAEAIALECKLDNPRFKRELFLRACGLDA